MSIEAELSKARNGEEFVPDIQDYGYLDKSYIQTLKEAGVLQKEVSLMRSRVDGAERRKGVVLKLSGSYSQITQVLRKEDNGLFDYFKNRYSSHGPSHYCFGQPIVGPDNRATFYVEGSSGYDAYLLEMLDEDSVLVKLLFKVAF